MSAAPALNFTAVNRGGRHVSGWLSPDHLSRFVEQAYEKRWRSLSVVTAGGDIVGEIFTAPHRRRRQWWYQQSLEGLS